MVGMGLGRCEIIELLHEWHIRQFNTEERYFYHDLVKVF